MIGAEAGDVGLEPVVVMRDPRSLRLLEVNARIMDRLEYNQLVENLKRDGALTSAPLIWRAPGDVEHDGSEEVLSGNHRVQAAIDAGLAEIPCLLLVQELSAQRRTAIQLSHNAIAGHDDPATLAQLYESLTDLDLREYTGLNDQELGLMAEVTVPGIGEAGLDFVMVNILFLPHEVDRALEAFNTAAGLLRAADPVWVARLDEHQQLLDSLQSAHAAWCVGNIATALGLVLRVFEEQLTGEIRDQWFDAELGEATREGTAPIESIFGTRVLRTDAAAVVAKAVKKALSRGDCTPGNEARMIELWAADYLAGS